MALRSDIGASAIRSRIVEGKLQHINSIYSLMEIKDLLKAVIQDMQDKNSNWWNKCIKYAEECKLTMKNVIRSTKKELKENIRNWDTEEWLKEVKVKVYNMYALELGKTGFLRTLGISCTLH